MGVFVVKPRKPKWNKTPYFLGMVFNSIKMVYKKVV